MPSGGHPSPGGVVAKGRKGSGPRRRTESGEEWTFLEKAFAVIIAVLVATTVWGFVHKDEVVKVKGIETYRADVDLEAGSEEHGSYSFHRALEKDYQFTARYKVTEVGPQVHFKVWNETTGMSLISEVTSIDFNRRVVLEPGEEGTYEFLWWVTGPNGTSRVDIDVLIMPTDEAVIR